MIHFNLKSIRRTVIPLLVFLFISPIGYSQERDINRLIQKLKDNKHDVYARGDAARALGYINDPRAIDALISALKDKDTKVRRSVAYAIGNAYFLGNTKDPRAIKPLIEAMKDDDSFVRGNAAKAIGYIAKVLGEKDPHAVDPLLTILKDEHPSVRKDAAYALAEINDPRAVKPLVSALKEKDLAVISGAHKFFIKRGELGTEAILIQALNVPGPLQVLMADNFLNSGNSLLIEAAKKWAKEHGLKIVTFPGHTTGPKWGEGI